MVLQFCIFILLLDGAILLENTIWINQYRRSKQIKNDWLFMSILVWMMLEIHEMCKVQVMMKTSAKTSNLLKHQMFQIGFASRPKNSTNNCWLCFDVSLVPSNQQELQIHNSCWCRVWYWSARNTLLSSSILLKNSSL